MSTARFRHSWAGRLSITSTASDASGRVTSRPRGDIGPRMKTWGRRSGKRRGGEEGRSRGAAGHLKKKKKMRGVAGFSEKSEDTKRKQRNMPRQDGGRRARRLCNGIGLSKETHTQMCAIRRVRVESHG